VYILHLSKRPCLISLFKKLVSKDQDEKFLKRVNNSNLSPEKKNEIFPNVNVEV